MKVKLKLQKEVKFKRVWSIKSEKPKLGVQVNSREEKEEGIMT